MIDRLLQKTRMVAIVAIVLGVVLGFLQGAQSLRSYLFGFMFITGLSLGSMTILLIYHLSGGGWGAVIRRFLEASIRVIPFLAILFLPIALGARHIYSWLDPEVIKEHPAIQAKLMYLNLPFFLGRAALFFAIWSLLSWKLNRLTKQQEKENTPEVQNSQQFLGGIGLVIFGLTMTFASIDWMMSLEPNWFSTIYGLLIISGQVLSSFAFSIAMLSLFSETEPLSEVVKPLQFHDLGKFMFAFVMIWAYLGFSQLLIMWSGNLPEEIPWYMHRWEGGWQAIAIMLIVLHFALPFLLLLSRNRKKKPGVMLWVAIGMMFMRLVDLFWMTAPDIGDGHFSIHLTDIVIPVALIATWFALFLYQLKKFPLVPVNDPELPEKETATHGALQHG